jgi:hypothetical protein
VFLIVDAHREEVSKALLRGLDVPYTVGIKMSKTLTTYEVYNRILRLGDRDV